MSSSKTVSSTTLLVVAASAAVSGCFDTAATPFPPGLEPLDATNVASFPPAVDGDPCPEALVLARAGEVGRATVVHARGCVHAPLDVVWRAIQNPQTGRDPSSTDPPFMVIAAPSPDECDGDILHTYGESTCTAHHGIAMCTFDVVDIDCAADGLTCEKGACRATSSASSRILTATSLPTL